MVPKIVANATAPDSKRAAQSAARADRIYPPLNKDRSWAAGATAARGMARPHWATPRWQLGERRSALRMGWFAVREEELRVEIVEEGMRASQGDCLGRRRRGRGTGERQVLAVRTALPLKLDPAGNHAGGHRRAVVPAPSAAAGRQRVGSGRQRGWREECRDHQQQQRACGGTAHANRQIIDRKTPPRARRESGDVVCATGSGGASLLVRSSVRLRRAKDDTPESEDGPVSVRIPAIERRFCRVLASMGLA